MSPFKTFTHNTVIILVVTCIITVQCFTMTTDGKCNKATHGKLRLYENRNGNDEMLVCAKKNGVYRWKFLDGSPSLGEKFDPAYDCTDIVDNVPNSKDDYYWIKTKDGKVVKVWCDVNTDGGGFMLIGMQDNPSSWNVSFNSSTVNPDGPSQWSSVFGNLKVREFAVQIGTKKPLDGIKAHWLYRFNSEREVGNILDIGKGGCTNIHAGIGDVKYVKDILANTVLLNNFTCSKFGPNVNSLLGWARMNHCFRLGCQTGYAYLSVFRTLTQLDNYGSFSYSAVSQNSGITHGSTAFVGCDFGKCCACFGPKGGQLNYCGTQCRSLNRGTVLQQANVLFWIRTAVPKRVWKRCMQFEMKTEKGSLETHFIDRATGSANKGSCSDNFHTFLNEGTLSVSRKDDLKNVPAVAGIFSYCKENKRVSVNDGNQWDNLAQEKEVLDTNKNVAQLQKNVVQLQKNVVQLEKKIENLTTILMTFFKDYHAVNFPFSSILTNNESYIKQLKQWLPVHSSWGKCWQASRDGWESKIFHQNCDFRGPTVTIIKVGVYIFGGYSDVSWGGSSGWRRSTKSFIFSFKNKDNLAPFKAAGFKNYDKGIYTGNNHGPVFGCHDIYISNNAHTSTNSRTNLGDTYQLPSSYSYRFSNTQALLAGSEYFQPSEIEVFFQP